VGSLQRLVGLRTSGLFGAVGVAAEVVVVRAFVDTTAAGLVRAGVDSMNQFGPQFTNNNSS
jgi:hypothetical protein